ncbi:MAG: PEGA domain-containing protein [Pseudomonadales bacterium]|nr:PEGA domain-containing protein [Pseudomonadales bacterium]
MSETTEKNNENDQDSKESLIQPTGFTPVDRDLAAKKAWIKPVSAIFALILLLLTTLIWYVFSARSVFISVMPEPQSLQIHGGVHFKVGERYLMRTGDYRLEASVSGYQPLEQTFQVTQAQNQTFSFTLSKLPGLITVESIPREAQVLVDGEIVGKTPLDGFLVEPGERHFEIRADRYLTGEQLLIVEGMHRKQSLRIELTPAWSEYEVSSSPKGADVWVDGVVRGQTPVTLELMAGEHEVLISLPGYKPWRQAFNVEPNQPEIIPEVVLSKLDGLARVSSKPSEANVTVNGEFRGQTPLAITLAPGQEYQISLFKPGYQVSKHHLKVRSAVEEELSVQLKPIVAQVKVTSQPSNAKVFIDGRYLGVGNQVFSLPTQKQKLEVRLEGYVTYQTIITPRVGLDQEVKVSLKTLEQAKWDAIKPIITSHAGDKLKLFRPNSFTMGASRREAGRRANEALTKVNLRRAFYLATKEVTNEQYRRYAKSHSSGNVQGHSLDGDLQPAVKMSWQDAALYCNWLSEKDGLPLAYKVENDTVVALDTKAVGYRLPTEAEWAWAARYSKGGLLKYPWGEELPPVEKSGNYADRSAAFIIGRIVTEYDDNYVVSAPVGSFSPNQNGLYDMGGNVSEWVNDFYATKSTVSGVTVTDPTGPEEGKYYVIRGSSWAHGSITELRLSYRDYGMDGRNDLGFRIARYVE